MSVCTACNKRLTDFEATRKIENSEGKIEYVDMCNTCFKLSGLGLLVPVIERYDLLHEESDEDWNEYVEEEPLDEELNNDELCG